MIKNRTKNGRNGEEVHYDKKNWYILSEIVPFSVCLIRRKSNCFAIDDAQDRRKERDNGVFVLSHVRTITEFHCTPYFHNFSTTAPTPFCFGFSLFQSSLGRYFGNDQNIFESKTKIVHFFLLFLWCTCLKIVRAGWRRGVTVAMVIKWRAYVQNGAVRKWLTSIGFNALETMESILYLVPVAFMQAEKPSELTKRSGKSPFLARKTLLMLIPQGSF